MAFRSCLAAALSAAIFFSAAMPAPKNISASIANAGKRKKGQNYVPYVSYVVKKIIIF